MLSWQSQPSQGLTNKVIQELINHDDRINSIHLFLRSKKGEKYGYFGKLGYLTHDTQREKARPLPMAVDAMAAAALIFGESWNHAYGEIFSVPKFNAIRCRK